MPTLRIAACVAFALGAGACSTPPPPEPPPAPAPAVVITPPPVQTAHSPDEDWNIFPDPTTGTIDIYHKGEYLGVIDGTEPTEQDPPLPHKSDKQPPPADY